MIKTALRKANQYLNHNQDMQESASEHTTNLTLKHKTTPGAAPTAKNSKMSKQSPRDPAIRLVGWETGLGPSLV